MFLAAFGVLVLAVVVLYIVAGAILIVSTASRVPFLIKSRRASFRLATGGVLAHFTITTLLYFIFTRLDGELYLMLNYPFFDSMPFFDSTINLIDILSGMDKSASTFNMIMIFKVYEVIFLWAASFIVLFIINLIVAPLRNLLSGKSVNLIKLFGFALVTFTVIVLFSFTVSMFRIKYIDNDDFGAIYSFNNIVSKDFIYTSESNATRRYKHIESINKWNLNLYDSRYNDAIAAFMSKDESIYFTTYSYKNKGIVLVTEKNGNLKETIVDKGDEVGGFYSLVLDNRNNVHISYLNRSKNKIKYATNIKGKWEIYTVNSEDYAIYWYTDIALDSNGVPYICSYDEVSGNLICHMLLNNNWEREVVDNTRLVSNSGFMNKDEPINLDIEIYDGDVNICYYSISDKVLKYSKRDNNGWTTFVIADNARSNFDFTLDSNGKGYITYLDQDYNLYYGNNENGDWSIKSINAKAFVSKIMVLSDGKIYIYYKNRSDIRKNGYLKLWSNRPMFP